MNKVKCLLTSGTEGINYTGLSALKQEYKQLLQANPFPAPPANGEVIAMIDYLKRKDSGTPCKIGVYENITPFEAANRIASDMVIINGLFQIMDQEPRLKTAALTLRLGALHEVGKGDFTIDGKEGEAFNVAPTFYKTKLQNTLKKWKNGKLSYILVNAEVVQEQDIENCGKHSIALIRVAWETGFSTASMIT